MRTVKSFRLGRRAVLRGAGVSLALPWLEVMAEKSAFGQAAVAPRALFFYWPTGYRAGDWLANPATPGTLTTFNIPTIATALTPFKSKLTFVTGTEMKPASVGNGGDGIHARGTGCSLVAEVLTKTGFTTGISADQVVARAVGTGTCIPSLALGVPGERPATFAEDGYGGVYYNNVSFTGPTSNVQKENKPEDLFRRLTTCSGFGTGGTGTMPPPPDPRVAFEKSVMAAVKVDAQRLMTCVGQEDKLRLDEYFTSITELERRFVDMPPPPGGGTAMCDKPAAPTTQTVFKDNAFVMMDLAVLAFKCGLTRVATMMLDGAFSRRNYGLPDIDGVDYIHGLSHGEIGGKTVDHPRWVKITTHYFELMAHLLEQMDAVKEGDRTLLDNTIVYFFSEFGNGDAHQQAQQPIIIAGGAGKLNVGRHIAVANGTPQANVLLTILQAMGVQRTSFGDSNGTIAGLGI
jgi:Protein of unknown function (DUF1552)